MSSTSFDPTLSGLQQMRSLLGQFAIGMSVLALALAVVSAICADGTCGNGVATWFAASGLIILSFLSIRTAVKMIRTDANTLWMPAAIFPLGTFLYFGFGSMSTFFSSQATRSWLMAGNYGLDGEGQLRALLLTCVGVSVATAFMRFGMRLRMGPQRSDRRRRVNITLPATAFFFITAGLTLNYGLVLPSQFGMIDVVVPGVLRPLTMLTDLGLAILAYMVAVGRKGWAPILWVLWPLQVGLGLLELSKLVTIFSILLPAVGSYMGHQNWRRLIPWIGVALLAYTSLQSVNTTARLTILQRTGSIGDANFSERIDLLGDIFSGGISLSDVSSGGVVAAQVWWLRLNYSGPQLRAMELYDQGIRGEWSLSLIELLIPRFLWPDKPVATAQGRIFNRIVSGNYEATTRVGITVYGNGYWAMGWPGVVIFSAIMGLILGIVTRINYRFVVERQLIYLPVIFFGMRMAAQGPIGFLQSSFIGALPIFVGYLAIVHVLGDVLRATKPQSRQARWHPERTEQPEGL